MRFQVRKHSVERQIDDSSNVLSKNPSRPDVPDDLKHSRPEVTVVPRSGPAAGNAERLAGKTPRHEIDAFQVTEIEIMYVPVLPDVRPVVSQNPAAPFVLLHLPRHAHPRPFQAQVHAADAGEKTAHSHFLNLSPLQPSALIGNPAAQAGTSDMIASISSREPWPMGASHTISSWTWNTTG